MEREWSRQREQTRKKKRRQDTHPLRTVLPAVVAASAAAGVVVAAASALPFAAAADSLCAGETDCTHGHLLLGRRKEVRKPFFERKQSVFFVLSLLLSLATPQTFGIAFSLSPFLYCSVCFCCIFVIVAGLWVLLMKIFCHLHGFRPWQTSPWLPSVWQ